MEKVKCQEGKNRILEIFKNGFCQSPGVTWMTDNSDRKLKALLSLFIDEAYVKNGAYLSSDKNGAVLFFQLQNSKRSLRLILRKMYFILFTLGLRKSIKAIKYKKLINSIRPKKGWLGWFVATDRSIHSTTAAYEIKNEMFRMADEKQQPIFIETTVKRVMLAYVRAGYKQYRTIKHPFEDLTIYFLKREPIII